MTVVIKHAGYKTYFHGMCQLSQLDSQRPINSDYWYRILKFHC